MVSVCEKGFKQMLNVNYGEMNITKLHKEIEDYY